MWALPGDAGLPLPEDNMFQHLRKQILRDRQHKPSPSLAHSSIHSFDKYLVSTYPGSGTARNIWGMSVIKEKGKTLPAWTTDFCMGIEGSRQ